MQSMKKTIQNKSFVSSFEVEKEYKSLLSYQEDFPLCEADYLRLKSGKSKFTYISQSIFLTTVGYFISIIAKLYNIYILDDNSIAVKSWEAITVIIGILFSILFFVIGKFLANDYKKVMNKIKIHFQNEPRRRIVGRENND